MKVAAKNSAQRPVLSIAAVLSIVTLLAPVAAPAFGQTEPGSEPREISQEIGQEVERAPETSDDELLSDSLPLPDLCEVDLGPVVTAGEASSGTFLVETEGEGAYVAAPTIETEIELTVSGLVVRGVVRQQFENPTTLWINGRYVFPLPENAAVDALRMLVGERVIEGEIQEREQAERTYEQARSEGRKASLVSQHRPNIFTTEVANVGPGEQLTVEIGYLQVLRNVDDSYRLRVPTVVAPRFGGQSDRAPGEPTVRSASHSRPHVVVGCELTTSSARIDAKDRSSGRLDLSVNLDAGGPLATIDSPSHSVRLAATGRFRYTVELDDESWTDRDFELVWRLDRGEQATARVFTEELDGEHYTLTLIQPPADRSAERLRLPRESVFVIDTSGSMLGTSIEQARSALLSGLEGLRPEDSFNVIEFNSNARKLFPSSVPVGNRSMEEAIDFLAELEATGGTNIRAALDAAFDEAASSYPVRQIVLMTDGAIGNEPELFDLIQQRLGDSRLFTVGIGSAPNSFFMRKAAQFGRGTFTHIGSVAQVEERMTALLSKLETPVITDLIADWGDPTAETFPARLPDLYAGEPLVIVTRSLQPLTTVELSGARGVVTWDLTVETGSPAPRSGIAKLWARAKLTELEDQLLVSDDPEWIREQALEVALGAGLVSRYTSLVAVDTTPTAERPTNETRLLPLRLPDGWTDPTAISGLPQTATPAPALALLGLLCLLCAAVAYRANWLWRPHRLATVREAGRRPTPQRRLEK